MSKISWAACCLILTVSASAVLAQDRTGDDIRSLDGQVQAVKSDVLNIATELNTLEERLLYPTHTQLSMFVSIDENEDFRLDAVQIHIDGQLATHHIYSFKELEALQSGGVQRVYTGNVTTGAHQLEVTVRGKLRNGDEFTESGSFTIEKGVKPKALGITLSGPGFGKDVIDVGTW